MNKYKLHKCPFIDIDLNIKGGCMAEILIVEDDNNINSLLCELLTNENSVTSAFSGE